MWLRKIVLYLLVFFILVGMVFYFVANSPYVIKKLADTFAPDYNITYDGITGNALTGISIKNPHFKNERLAENIRLKWNPNTLIAKRITLDKLEVKEANVTTIKKLLNRFQTANKTEKTKTKSDFAFSVDVNDADISLTPFREKNIFISKARLKSSKLRYTKEKFNVGNFVFALDTNVTDIYLKGKFKKQVLTLDEMSIKDTNISAIEKLFPKNEKKSVSNKDAKTSDNLDAFLPKRIDIHKLAINILSMKYKNIYINSVDLKANALDFDIEKQVLKNIDNLVFNVDTNVTKASLKGSLYKQLVLLDEVKLEDVNISALTILFASDDSKIKSKNNTTQPSKFSIPKYVKIKKLKGNILSVNYEPIKIKQAELEAKSVDFNVEKLTLENAIVTMSGSTNFSNVSYEGKIKDNHLLGKVIFKPKKKLYKYYGLPLREDSLAKIVADVNASTQKVVAIVKTKGKQVLKGEKGTPNIDVEKLTSHISYSLDSHYLQIDSNATVSMPYAKNVYVTNHFKMDDKIYYDGKIRAKKLKNLETQVIKPLQNLLVEYKGDAKSIHTLLSSDALKGNFDSNDFKKGILHLETLKPIVLKSFVKLPKALESTKLKVSIDTPISFSNMTTMQGKVKIVSNVVTMDADVNYGKDIKIKAKLEVPKNSLLKAYNKDIKWQALSPMYTTVKLVKNSVVVTLKSKQLNANVNYALKKESIKGEIKIGGLVTKLNGDIKKRLNVDAKLTSMSALRKNINAFYPIGDLPALEGTIDASLRIDNLKTAELILRSKKLIYKADKKTKHTLNDVKLVATMDASKIVLKSYKVTFDKQKYYASKAAVISLGDTINISNFWINDELKIVGKYQPKTQKASFTANAKYFHIKDKLADIYTKIDAKIELDGENTQVRGKIILLKGKVTPNMKVGRSFASDSDIIILQEIQKTKKSPFMDNLSLALKVETKQALRLKQGAINIRLKPDFAINKDRGGKMLYFGSVILPSGGTYVFEKKRFVLAKSYIYFTGNVQKPLLDLKAKYKSIDHLITIAVAGTPAKPRIKFSSNPTLTREQILSIILFDTESGSDTHSGNEMMKMMGGAMAKSALSNVGINIDHLAFGEGNSIEVGKKLNSRTTVIYINGDVPKIKLKYQNNKNTESVIQVDEESQSFDIIYKKDF